MSLKYLLVVRKPIKLYQTIRGKEKEKERKKERERKREREEEGGVQ